MRARNANNESTVTLRCLNLGHSDGPLGEPSDPHILLVQLKDYGNNKAARRMMMHSRLFGVGDSLAIRCIHFYERDTRLVVVWHFYDPVRLTWRKKRIVNQVLTAPKWNWTWRHRLKHVSRQKQRFVFKFTDAETNEKVSDRITYRFYTAPAAFKQRINNE